MKNIFFFITFSLSNLFSASLIDLQTGHYHNKKERGSNNISNIYLVNHSEYRNGSKIDFHFMNKVDMQAEFPSQKTIFTNKKVTIDYRLRKSKTELPLQEAVSTIPCEFKIHANSENSFTIEAKRCSDEDSNFIAGEYILQDLGEHTKFYQKEVRRLEKN